MNSFDWYILSFFNRFAHRSFIFDELVILLSVNNLLKGGVIVGIIWWVWFESEDSRRKREALLTGLIGSVPALVIAKILSAVMFRARPAYEIRLLFSRPYGMQRAEFGQLSSFPSDHAVLFFALATGIFIASRRAGWLAFIYVSGLICLPRIYLGEHYPTDVLAGAAIGMLPVWLANRPRIRKPLTNWALQWMDSRPSQFYCFSFLVTYQIAELFDSLIKIAHFVSHGRII
jgi:undecaprenyl-diphosphatase